MGWGWGHVVGCEGMVAGVRVCGKGIGPMAWMGTCGKVWGHVTRARGIWQGKA